MSHAIDIRRRPVVRASTLCASGGYSSGLCVLPKHELVVASCHSTNKLSVHSLVDGSLIYKIGGHGCGEGQFNLNCGGLCTTPDGDGVLVAEAHNNRLQQILIADGSTTRIIGTGILITPEFVDCNEHFIAVSENIHRVSVLAWVDGSVISQFGQGGDVHHRLAYPYGLRLLATGGGVVVTDSQNHRLCVFSLYGEFVGTLGSRRQGLNFPCDVLECVPDDSFIVANKFGDNIVRLGRSGTSIGTFYAQGPDEEFKRPAALAALTDNTLLVRSEHPHRITRLLSMELRFEWLQACATLTSTVTCSVDGVGIPILE